ncbi:MAG TPA: oxidoreductase [Allosphingosinicella sp.]|jgi:scyllo-inositol 2-dehydrogenase (NADP+)
MIRAGLIGRGMAGTVFHAPLLRATPGVELAAIAGSAEAPGLIASPDIDLVVIATPNTTHYALAAAALKAGKHVVIDKPFAVSAQEAEALIALAGTRQRLLTVFHNRRWDGDFLTIEALLRSGRLGDLRLFEGHWDRLRPAIKQGWREVPADGAGLLWDLGPHLIDQALRLFGLPHAIQADIAVQRGEAAVDDYFHLTLHYGPMRAILSASTLIADPRPRFDLHGTEASFRKFGLDPQEARLKAGEGVTPELGREDPASHGTLTSADGARETIPTESGRYLGFYEAVAAAIRGEAPAPVDPTDALTGLRLIALARESARTGRRLPVAS